MESLDRYTQALNRLSEQGLIDAVPSLFSLKPGETVFHAEEPADRIFGVHTGKIQLVRYLENGQMTNQYALESGLWFGESALFHDVYPNSAIATQPSEIIAIPTHTFLTLLRHESDLSLLFMAQLIEQLHMAKDIMSLRCIRSAYERVLAYLHGLKTPNQRVCMLDRSIKEIAEQICLTPEVVSRSLRKLQDDGVIRRNQRKVTFLES
ncbi:MAG: Crp/Fnr family transcriptional regulator [Cyanobacteria bacterium P01_H01_bin.21]